MKKFKLPVALLLLSATCTFTSCSDDDDSKPVEKRTAFVTLVDGGETAAVNQEVKLNVSFIVDNLCGSFGKFTEVSEATGKSIVVEAKYEGENCGQAIDTLVAEYKFKAATAGSYILKFKKSATESVNHTVVVK